MPNDNPENVVKMMEPLIEMANESVKDIVPENVVAQFVQENFPALMKLEAKAPLIEMSNGIIVKMLVNQANTDVQYSLKSMLAFYESFRVFYKELVKKTEDQNEPEEDPDEECGCKDESEEEKSIEDKIEEELNKPEEFEKEAALEDEKKWRNDSH